MFGTVEKQRYVFVPKPTPKPLPVTLVKFAVTAAGFVIAVIVRAAWWAAQQSTIGRHRAKIAPLWVGLIACIPWSYAWWASASLLWQSAAGCAVVAAWLPARFGYGPKFLSVRERWILSSGWSCAGVWHLTSGILPWQWWAAGWVVIVIGHSIPWWIGRRVRPVVDARHELEIEWAEKITDSPDAQALTGSVLTVDQQTGHGRLKGVPKHGDLSGLDDHAARLLSRPRGTVSISIDPDGDANDYLVAFTDREDPIATRWWDGPSLTPDGRYIAGYTRSGAPIHGRLWRPGGGAFSLMLGGPGSGKGNLVRITLTEGVLSPHVYTAAADCKGVDQGGSGIPEVADGCDIYATRREEWEALVLLSYEIMGARAARYGDARRSRWSPEVDPLWMLAVDEIARLANAFPKLVKPMEEMSGLGRSFGMGLVVDTQIGKGPNVISTDFRANIRSGGTAFMGAAGDIQAQNAATQAWQIDLSKLPKAPGWMYAVSGIDTIPMEPFRGVRLPSEEECRDERLTAPHGTAEQWMRRARRATLHPQDQEIVDKWAARFAVADLIGDVPGAAERPALTVVQSSRSDARARVLAAVPDPPDVARKGEIAEAAGVSPDVAKWHLRILSDGDGPVVRVGEGNDTAYQKRSAS